MIQYQSGYSDGDNVEKSDGATYLDPLTKTTYVWNAKDHQWKPQTMKYNYPDNYRYTNPQDGKTYAWSLKEQKWKIVENEANQSSCGVNNSKSSESGPDQSKTTNEQKPVDKSNAPQGKY